MSRFTNDLDAVGEMLNNTMSQIFSGIITLVGTVALMFFTNWILAIIIIVTVPLMVYVGGMIGKQSRKYFIGQQQASVRLTDILRKLLRVKGDKSVLP